MHGMPDAIPPPIHPAARLHADLIGAACGTAILLLHGTLTCLPLAQVYSQTVIGGMLSAAILADFLTVLTKPYRLMSRSQATGIEIQLGWRAGARAVMVGGA
jgi:hypothetical protein